MPSLLDDRFSPLTERVGFLDVSMERVTDALLAWKRVNGVLAEAETFEGSLPEGLRRLEPLTNMDRTRQLLAETRSTWTAYFDNGMFGGDPVSQMSYLAQYLGCRGLAVTLSPHTVDRFAGRCGSHGGVQFEMFGPRKTHFLNYVRGISAIHDGERWVFDADGDVQPFEVPERYRARRVADRFTPGMLEAYCLALGIHLLEPSFYGRRLTLVLSRQAGTAEVQEVSLAEVQRRHCLGPYADPSDPDPGQAGDARAAAPAAGRLSK